jgi:hypothetical protein
VCTGLVLFRVEPLFRAPGFRVQSQTGGFIELRLTPQWTRELTPVPGSELDIGLSYGQLELAPRCEISELVDSGEQLRIHDDFRRAFASSFQECQDCGRGYDSLVDRCWPVPGVPLTELVGAI